MKVPPLNVNDKNENKKLSYFTTTSLVIANIIGTDIFVSLGFQAISISSQFCLLFTWFISGRISNDSALYFNRVKDGRGGCRFLVAYGSPFALSPQSDLQ